MTQKTVCHDKTVIEQQDDWGCQHVGTLFVKLGSSFTIEAAGDNSAGNIS